MTPTSSKTVVSSLGRILAGTTVHRFAEQVRMTGVTAVLLERVTEGEPALRGDRTELDQSRYNAAIWSM